MTLFTCGNLKFNFGWRVKNNRAIKLNERIQNENKGNPAEAG